MERVLAVNFKVYESAFGERALLIARGAREVQSTMSRVRIILAVPSLTVGRIAGVYEDVFLQHVDPVGLGAHTGYTPVESLPLEGVKGTIVNHSEHKVKYRELEAVISRAREAGVETIACADTPGEAAGIAYLNPTMIAVEPPELIGTGIPVSKAKPEVITRGVKAVKKIAEIPVLAGAGITTGEDAERAVQLGAHGVLVASTIMKAGDPIKRLEELATSLEK